MKITKNEIYTIKDIEFKDIELIYQGLDELVNKDGYNSDESHRIGVLIQSFEEIIG